MKRKHQKTLEQIYKRPTSGNIPWTDIESLFKALDARIFYGKNPASLRREFKNSLKVYLEVCEEKGIAPKKRIFG